MRRVLLLAVLAVILAAFNSGAAVAFDRSSMPLQPIAILLAYAILAEPFVEGGFAALVLGLLLDIVGGAPLGLHGMCAVLVWLAGRVAIPWVRSPQRWAALPFTAAISAALQLAAGGLVFIFRPDRVALDVVGIAWGAFFDGLVCWFVFALVHFLMHRFGLDAAAPTWEERIDQIAQK